MFVYFILKFIVTNFDEIAEKKKIDFVRFTVSLSRFYVSLGVKRRLVWTALKSIRIGRVYYPSNTHIHSQ